jgi:hypothetical protein
MAGTATNYDILAIPQGVIAQIWTGMAVPAAGARATLFTDGTPDATANPSAINLGYTDAGLTVNATETSTDFFADEAPFPIGSSVDTAAVSITGTALQVNDEDVMKVLAANIATYSTAAGYKQFTLGFKSSLSTTGVAVIYPSRQRMRQSSPCSISTVRVTPPGFTFSIGTQGSVRVRRSRSRVTQRKPAVRVRIP